MLVVLVKKETAYGRRIRDWSSDVCAADLQFLYRRCRGRRVAVDFAPRDRCDAGRQSGVADFRLRIPCAGCARRAGTPAAGADRFRRRREHPRHRRSEEHTSELQSLMRISYAVFCLKTKKRIIKLPSTYYTSTTIMSW